MRIAFTVPAVPVAQPRPRAVTVCGRSRIITATTKHPINAFKATTRMVAETEHRGVILRGPLKLRVVFVMPRPLNRVWKKQAMPRYHHTSRPDCDNLVKGVMDALNGILWNDDTQIAELICHKYVASGDERPHVEIEIEELKL